MFDQHLDIRWGRRLITTPLWYLLSALMIAATPIAVPLLGLWDLIAGRRWSAVRTWLFFGWFFTVESVGLIAALGIWLRALATRPDAPIYHRWNRQLQRWWSQQLFWGCVRIFDVEVSLHGRDILEDDRDALVMSRHASTLDTMIPLAIVRGLRDFRYVIKAELLADPAMDYVAQRFPNCFVRRGGQYSDTEVSRVVALGETLEPGGALVIYPEGTRFTPQKRARLVEKFSAHDPDGILDVVDRLGHTLPPLRQGAMKLVETMTDADVVFLAHRGLGEAGAMSDLIHGGLTGAHLEVLLWRVDAADAPRDPAEIREFLVSNWERIDRFVAGADESRSCDVGLEVCPD